MDFDFVSITSKSSSKLQEYTANERQMAEKTPNKEKNPLFSLRKSFILERPVGFGYNNVLEESESAVLKIATLSGFGILFFDFLDEFAP